jgi:hypothetical protein
MFPTRPVRDPSPLRFIAVAAFSAPQLARFSAHAHTRYFYVSAQILFDWDNLNAVFGGLHRQGAVRNAASWRQT